MLRDWQLNIKKTLGTSDEGGPEEKEGNVMDLTLDEEESSPGLARSSRGKRKEASSSETTDGVFLTATGKRIRLSDKMKTYTLNFGSGYPSGEKRAGDAALSSNLWLIPRLVCPVLPKQIPRRRNGY